MKRYAWIAVLVFVATPLVAGLGWPPEEVALKYGDAAKVDRSAMHLGTVHCTYPIRMAAGVTVEPWVQFVRDDQDRWVSQVISYSADGIQDLDGETILALLEDIQKGNWVTRPVPEMLREMHAAYYHCYQQRRSGGRSTREVVATAILTRNGFLTVTYRPPKPDPAEALAEIIQEISR